MIEEQQRAVPKKQSQLDEKTKVHRIKKAMFSPDSKTKKKLEEVELPSGQVSIDMIEYIQDTDVVQHIKD